MEFATLSLIALAGASPAQAQGTNWNGAIAGNWFTPGNWTNGVPASGSNARINAGSAVVGSPGATANILTLNSGALIIQNAGTLSTGAGGIINMTGTVTVDGAGSAWISTGGVVVGFSGAGTSTLTIQNSGVVSGTNGLVAQNVGTTGTVTVDGSTWANSSVLDLGYSGNGTLTIQNGGAVSNTEGRIGFNTGSTGTATVDGAGSTWTNSGLLYVGYRGTGTLTIRNGGAVSSVGATVIAGSGSSSGTLNIGAASGEAAAAPGTLTAPSINFGSGTGTGRIVFNHTATNYLLAPAISGVGTVSVEAGTTILTGNSTYSGGTTISGGTLQLGNGGTSGSITGSVTNNGMLAFNRSDVVSFSGTISGAGAVNQIGTGTTILTGTHTYTGPTTVNGGTLSIAAGGAIASATTVNTGGTLIVNGNSAAVTVNSGGTLGGTGTLGNAVVAGGTLSPGNSIGAITVDGTLALTAASTYRVEVNAAGQSDRTQVTGTATLGGSVQVIAAPGSYLPYRTYTILNAAGGRSGTFSGATVNSVFLTPSLTYDPTSVFLMLEQRVALASVAQTPNQAAAATATQSRGLSDPVYGAVVTLATDGQARRAFDALSGEVHASTVSTLANDSLFMRAAILGRLRQASYGPGSEMASMAALSLGGPQAAFADGAMESALAYAKSPATSSPIVTKAPIKAPQATSDTVFWAQGFGAWGRFDGDGNATSVKRDLAGFITGADTRVANNGRLGIAAGYTGAKASSLGTANVDTAHVAGYGGWGFGNVNLRAGGAYAFHTIDTDRMVNFPGFADRLMSRYDGSTSQVFGEIGYGTSFGNMAFEPFAGAAWVRVSTDSTAEKGGAAALNVAARTFETGYSTLGMRAASIVPLADDMILIPRATLAWQHAFDDVTPNATMAFQVTPANAFAISGVPIARDSLLVEGGLDLAIGRTITVGLSYVGQIGNAVTDHAVKGKLSWVF